MRASRLSYHGSIVDQLQGVTKGWAKLARKLATSAATMLIERRVDEGHALAEGLRSALAEQKLRVPNAVRDAIGHVNEGARALVELQGIMSGRLVPSFDSAGRALSLRMWWRQMGELAGGETSLLPKELVRRVAADLPEDGGALRSQYDRAASQWEPLQEAVSTGGERVE